jgi:small redox-active disulfide protein 2
MITIKVLGSGCPNCKKVEAVVRRTITDMSLEADIIKVTDYGEMMEYPILSTPGLVIDENLVCSGRIPSESEVSVWLADAAVEAA